MLNLTKLSLLQSRQQLRHISSNSSIWSCSHLSNRSVLKVSGDDTVSFLQVGLFGWSLGLGSRRCSCFWQARGLGFLSIWYDFLSGMQVLPWYFPVGLQTVHASFPRVRWVNDWVFSMRLPSSVLVCVLWGWQNALCLFSNWLIAFEENSGPLVTTRERANSRKRWSAV